MTNTHPKAPVDWLMPRAAGLPKVRPTRKRTLYDLVSAALYWAERNGAQLPSHPSPLRQRNAYKAWVRANGYYAIIFSHAWAKKFYGDASYCTCRDITHEGKCWEYHLGQQVLYRERGRHAPLAYIAKVGL